MLEVMSDQDLKFIRLFLILKVSLLQFVLGYRYFFYYEVEGSLCYIFCINSRIVDIYQFMVMVVYFIFIKVGKGEILFFF